MPDSALSGTEALRATCIASAIRIQTELGPGFLESLYEAALVLDLRRQGLRVSQQPEVPVMFRGQCIGKHRLDLVINQSLLLELKCVKYVEFIHVAIVRSYLAATGLTCGLILNFGTLPLEIRRVVPREPAHPDSSVPAF